MPQPNRYVTARLSIRRGTKDQWEQQDTVLLEGEPGWEIDTRRLKIGDGQLSWSNLPYYTVGDSEAAGSFIHDESVLPSHVNSVSSAVEYLGAKFKVYDDFGEVDFMSGFNGGTSKHIFTLVAGTGGVASHDGADNIFDYNSQVNITAVPFAGYEFDYWTGNIASESIGNPQAVVLITQDEYARANFKLITP